MSLFEDDIFDSSEEESSEEVALLQGSFLFKTENVTKKPEKATSNAQEEIRKILEAARAKSDIRLIPAIRKNVIFVGKSRVGKTTAIEILKDPTHLVKDMNIFADTMQPKLYDFTIGVKAHNEQVKKAINQTWKQEKKHEQREAKEAEERDKLLHQFIKENKDKTDTEIPKDLFTKKADKGDEKKEKKGEKEEEEQDDEDVEEIDQINFNINIIDTPGLFERAVIGKKTRKNDSLKDTILECLNNQIASIHAIFFVCSVKTGVSEEDLVAFEEFLELFSGAESIVAVLFTRTENFTIKQKQNVVGELRQYKKFASLLQKVDNRIFFSGSASFEDLDNALRLTMNKTINSVACSRNSLLQFIFFKTKPCSIRNFNILIREAVRVSRKLESLDTLLDKAEKTEKEHQQVSEYIAEIAKNSHLIPVQYYDLLSVIQNKYETYKKQKKPELKK